MLHAEVTDCEMRFVPKMSLQTLLADFVTGKNYSTGEFKAKPGTLD